MNGKQSALCSAKTTLLGAQKPARLDAVIAALVMI